MDQESPPENNIFKNGSKVKSTKQPQTLASMLKDSTSDARQELEVSVDQMIGKVKSVFYYISNRWNRKSILDFFRKSFKSLAFESFRFYQSPDGIRFTVLEIGLFINAPNYLAELARTASISYKNSTLESVPDEDLDEAGQFIPRPQRKILVSGFGLHELTAEKLEIGFEDVLEFPSNPRIVLLGDRKSGRFSGDAVITVHKFKALPKKDFDFKLTGGGFLRITVKSYGFSKALLETEKKECYRCRKLGHLAVDCPSRPKKFSWKCTVCQNESTEFGCTVRKCLASLAKFSAETTENMFDIFDPKDIKEKYGVDHWINVKTDFKPVDPGAGQTMLALKYSSTIKAKLMQGDYEEAYNLVQRWVTIKLDEHTKNLATA